MHHTAFEYDSFGDLMESFDRLREEGMEPAFCLDHEITISLYYKDPDAISSNCKATRSEIGTSPANLLGRPLSLPKTRLGRFSIQPWYTTSSSPAPISAP
jgi:hypothetical protein